MNDEIKKWLTEMKRFWFIPVMILGGILLMTVRPGEAKETSAPARQDAENFVVETQARITQMLKDVEGAGECVVTITLASGGKKEYVRQDGEVLVITDKDGNQSAVVSKETAPEIAGVTVASTGADRVEVRRRIISSVSTVLGIGANKICVIMRE